VRFERHHFEIAFLHEVGHLLAAVVAPGGPAGLTARVRRPETIFVVEALSCDLIVAPCVALVADVVKVDAVHVVLARDVQHDLADVVLYPGHALIKEVEVLVQVRARRVSREPLGMLVVHRRRVCGRAVRDPICDQPRVDFHPYRVGLGDHVRKRVERKGIGNPGRPVLIRGVVESVPTLAHLRDNDVVVCLMQRVYERSDFGRASKPWRPPIGPRRAECRRLWDLARGGEGEIGRGRRVAVQVLGFHPKMVGRRERQPRDGHRVVQNQRRLLRCLAVV